MSSTRLAAAPSGSDLPPPNLHFPSSMRTRKRRPAFVSGTIATPQLFEVDASTECTRAPNASQFLKTSFLEDTNAPNPYASTAPGTAWSDRVDSRPVRPVRPAYLTNLDLCAYGFLDIGLDPTDGKAPLGFDGKVFTNVMAHRGNERVEGEQLAELDIEATANELASGPEVSITLSPPDGADFSLWDKNKPACFNPTALSPIDANRDKWGVVLDKQGQVVVATEEEKSVDGWLTVKIKQRDGWKSEKMAERRRKQGKETALEELPVRRGRW